MEIEPIESVQNTSLPRQEQRRVLVVDDQDENRILLRFFLQGAHINVLEAVNGQEAIEVARREHPHVILMDLSMPVLDGFEATRLLKLMDETKHIPIVAVSAHCNDPAQCVKAISAGCIECIDKPIRFDKIGAVLKGI